MSHNFLYLFFFFFLNLGSIFSFAFWNVLKMKNSEIGKNRSNDPWQNSSTKKKTSKNQTGEEIFFLHSLQMANYEKMYLLNWKENFNSRKNQRVMTINTNK